MDKKELMAAALKRVKEMARQKNGPLDGREGRGKDGKMVKISIMTHAPMDDEMEHDIDEMPPLMQRLKKLGKA